MKATTELYKETIKKNSREFKFKAIVDNQILEVSDFKLKKGVISEETIYLGDAFSSYIEGKIKNPPIILEGQKIIPKIGLVLDDGTVEDIQLGVFTITSATKNDNLVEFKAYDNFLITEKGFFTNLKGVQKIKTIVDEQCKKIGITFITDTGNLSVNVEKLNGYTIREVFATLAGYCGKNAVMNCEGNLEFKFFSNAPIQVGANRFAEPLKISENRVVITGIKCMVDEENELVVGNNPPLLFSCSVMTKERLNEIYNELKDFAYYGCELDMIMGQPELEPGDVLNITDKNGQVYNVPIFDYELNFDGGVYQKIYSRVKSETQQEFEYKGPLTTKVDRIVSDIVTTKKFITDTVIAFEGQFDTINTNYLTINNKLTAFEGEFEKLKADSAEFVTIVTDKITAFEGKFNEIETIDLKAINAKLDKAEIGIADINTLLSGSVSSGSTHTIVLNAKNTTIENALIKNAMIDTLSFDKITGIDINTSKFTVHSNDGKSLWQDNTILIKDANRTRVQIGKDASNDYNIYIWDKNGKLMFDATGVTANGIQKPIIRDDMVSETANISGSKLNINSVIKKINEDGSENISSSKIWIDEENQSLGASFTQLKDYADKGYFESVSDFYSGKSTKGGIEIGRMEGAYIQEGTPSPDNPIEPKFFNPTKFTIAGKNLLYVKNSNYGRDGVNFKHSKETDLFEYSGIATHVSQSVAYDYISGESTNYANYLSLSNKFPIKKGTYTFKLFDISSESIAFAITYGEKGKSGASGAKHTGIRTANTPLTINVEKDCYLAVMGNVWNTADGQKRSAKISMTSGLEDVETFTKPVEYINVSIPLSAPLRALPNGVCDTYENGIITRRVGKVVFDGSDDENFTKVGTRFSISVADMLKENKDTINVVCSHLIARVSLNEGYIYANNGTLMLMIEKTDVNELKAWLQQNPITVYYELATATTEEFIIQKLPSYYDYTNVWHDSEVSTNITWQIKSYVETKVSQTDFAVEQGKISALISENTQIKGDVSSLNSKYNEIKASIDSFGVTIKDHTTKITNVTNTVNNNKATWDKAGTALTNANNALSKIDGLEVGGRNYALQTKDEKSKDEGGGEYAKYDLSPSKNSLVGKELIVSCYIKKTNDTVANLYAYLRSSSGSISGAVSKKIGDITKEYVRYVMYIPAPTQAIIDSAVTVAIHTTSNVGLKIKEVKLEIGNKPTDWTPAPEDIDNEIKTVTDKTASLQLTLDNFKTTVSNTYATKAQLSTVDGKFVNYSTTAQMNSAIDQKANEINTSVSKTYATQVQLKTANDNISALLTWKGSAEQKITDSAIVSTVTKSSSWTTLNTNVNNATTKINNLVDLTTIKDTRDKNENPQYYFTNYPKKTVKEFKSCSKIGISGEGIYGTLITEISWTDSSGGYPVQLFYPNNSQNIYRRVGTSNTAWGSWTKVAGTHNVVSTINQTAENIKIQASKIQLEGIVTANSRFKILADGSMEAVNGTFIGKITGSTIIGSTIELTNNRAITVYESDKDKIMNHIMGTSILTGSEFTRLDVNRDGIIDSLDYAILIDLLNGKFPKNFTDYVTINTLSPDKMITVGTKNSIYDTNVKIGTGKIEARYGIYHSLTANTVKLYNGRIVFSEKGWQDGFSIEPMFDGAGDNNVLNFVAGTGGEGEYIGGMTAMQIKGQSCTVSMYGDLGHHGPSGNGRIGSSSSTWQDVFIHTGNYYYNDGHSTCYTDHVGAPRVARIAFAADYIHFENTNNAKAVGIKWDLSSDLLIKHGVMPSTEKSKDKINKIKFYDFYYNDNLKHEKIGFIANQLEEIDEDFVYKNTDKNDNYLLIPNKDALLINTIKALQELDNEVRELREQIKQLTERSI